MRTSDKRVLALFLALVGLSCVAVAHAVPVLDPCFAPPAKAPVKIRHSPKRAPASPIIAWVTVKSGTPSERTCTEPVLSIPDPSMVPVPVFDPPEPLLALYFPDEVIEEPHYVPPYALPPYWGAGPRRRAPLSYPPMVYPPPVVLPPSGNPPPGMDGPPSKEVPETPYEVHEVPEPAPVLLFMAACVGLFAFQRRKSI